MRDTPAGRRPGGNPALTLQRMEMLFLMGLTSLDGVFPVIPSEVAVLAAGVLAHTLWPVVLAAAVGVFIGDHLAYGLARSVVGPRLISRSKRISRAVGVAAGHLDRRAPMLIVASRFLPGGRVTMNLACGTAAVPLLRFTPASAVAALAWATYTAGLGYMGGATFAENPLLGIAAGLGLSVALGGVIELIRRRSAARRASTTGRSTPGAGIEPVSGVR
jgi:membrane protein DedA with SNARE-associated domain